MVDCRRWIDLAISSPKRPGAHHLFVEVSNGDLWMNDFANIKILLKSTDKGLNWSTIATRAQDIRGLWYDRSAGRLYGCTTIGLNVNHAAFNILLSDDSENEMGTWSSLAVINQDGRDIFKIGTDFYVTDYYDNGGTVNLAVRKWVDPNWNVDASLNIHAGIVGNPSSVVIVGTDAYFLDREVPAGPGVFEMSLVKFDSTVPSLTELFGSIAYDFSGASRVITYDGSNILTFLLNKVADSLDYLQEWNISGATRTEKTTFNVILMSQRFNIGTPPNEVEKAFGSTNKITYETKSNRGGIVLLQDLSAILTTNIIAISDNFLIVDDIGGGAYPMFEWTNVAIRMDSLFYDGGIIPIPKLGSFHVSSIYKANWNEEDSFKYYDDNNVLEIWAKITKRYIDLFDNYHYDFDFYSNEMYRPTYNKVYISDDTDAKQKDIIDNKFNFCYRSSSIVATTITYSYTYVRRTSYLFDLARFLERQVGYVETDAKVWTKAYDGLTKAAQHYPDSVGLKDDIVGGNPSAFTVFEGGGTVNVISEWQGHKNVIEMHDTSNAASVSLLQTFTAGAQEEGNIEFYIGIDDVSDDVFIRLRSGTTTNVIRIRAVTNQWQAYYSGAFNNIGATLDGVKYHFRVYFYDDGGTTKFSVWLDETQVVTDETAEGNNDITNFYILSASANLNYKIFVDGLGYDWESYTVGDNVVAWTLNDGNQIVQMIDIKDIALDRGGYFKGSLGVTRATVRYKNNATSTKPTIPASGKTATEELTGIIELKEFRDPKLEASTEADQLATNLHAIFSSTIQFIGLRVEGEGFLQEGKTLHLENVGQIPFTAGNFLILKYRRWPLQDVTNMVVSDNIILPSEFTSFMDSTRLQIHSANLQAFENQSAIAVLPSVINQILMTGVGGFVKSDRYGAVYSVVFSDVDAGVFSTFYVGNGGSFKVSIMHSGTGNNFGKTAGGVINISYDVDGGLESWNIGDDFNLPLEDLRYLKIEQSGTAFTVANNSKVGVLWTKDDNAGGAGGVFSIYGMFLTRQ